MKHMLLAGLVTLFGGVATAQAPVQEGIYNTRTNMWLTVDQAAAELDADTIVVLGEQHVTRENEKDQESILHHANQWRWLKAVGDVARARLYPFQLGMEFLNYPTQSTVDGYLTGGLTESEFLQKSGWGSNPFAPYGRVMWESVTSSGNGTVALNIPRTISSQVSKSGPNSLTPEQQAFLPPIWEKGGPDYWERFRATMIGHVPEEKILNYFWAQSLWDDTMAWRATHRANPGQLTIIVGEFHAEFGHGLPARLSRYGARDVRTMIQVAVENGTPLDAAVKPDPKYGQRADYIWVFTK